MGTTEEVILFLVRCKRCLELFVICRSCSGAMSTVASFVARKQDEKANANRIGSIKVHPKVNLITVSVNESADRLSVIRRSLPSALLPLRKHQV